MLRYGHQYVDIGADAYADDSQTAAACSGLIRHGQRRTNGLPNWSSARQPSLSAGE